MKNLYENEPTVIITAITTFVAAVIALLPLFGVPLTAEQASGIMAVVVALAGIVSAVWIRGLVTPVANPHDHDGNKLYADEVMVP